MPNNVNNTLIIRGPVKDLIRFRHYAKGNYPYTDTKKILHKDGTQKITTVYTSEKLCFNKFIPMPLTNGKPIEYSGKLLGTKDGYNWCCENWGTKWGAYEVDVNCSKDELIYDFQTAWSPPSDILLIVMSKKFPGLTLELEYEDTEGGAFEGTMKLNDGKIILDDQRDFVPRCDWCNEKVPGTEYIEKYGANFCKDCLIEYKKKKEEKCQKK